MKKICLLISALLIFSAFIVFAEETDGYIFTVTSDNFSKTGSWSETAETGYQTTLVSESSYGGEAGWSLDINRGTYKVYFWLALNEFGCRNAEVTFSCTTVTETRELDLARGQAGFVEIGVYSISDGKADLRLKGDDGRLLISAIKLYPQEAEYVNAAQTALKSKNNVVLKTNSPLAFVNGFPKEIPDSVPIIINNKTLVPLRFISEYFGADVEWDGKDARADIFYNGIALSFWLDKGFYTKNGETIQLEQPPVLINNHILLPIRDMAESIGKQVFWNNSGIIITADEIKLDPAIDKELIENIEKIYEREER